MISFLFTCEQTPDSKPYLRLCARAVKTPIFWPGGRPMGWMRIFSGTVCGWALLVAPCTVMAQQACQPFQGTPTYATCVNEQLSRHSRDRTLEALEQQARGAPTGFVSPELHLNQRDAAPPPAYAPGYAARLAEQRLRLDQSTQARSQALSGQIRSRVTPAQGALGLRP